MIILTKTEQQIANMLVEAAQRKETISFTDIMESAGISRKTIGGCLSHIGTKCKELGLPVLTVLVVYKGTDIVGTGYSEFAADFENDSEIAKIDQEKVFAQKSWEKIYKNVSDWNNDILLNDVENTRISATEGELSEMTNVFVRKRDALLRNECLKQKGKVCSICGFDPVKKYGKGFENIIEVHHLDPIAGGKRETTIDDLIPVCPNCHRALHSKPDGLYKPNDLKDLIKEINN